MKRNDRIRSTGPRRAVAAVVLAIAVPGATATQRESHAADQQAHHEARREARGEFDVRVAPLARDDDAGIVLGRMSLEKTFRGALVATSKGEMLTVETRKKDSGAYAATERVTGTLEGRRGSFALVHVGTMANGGYSLTLSIVPDSGTDELTGIAGTLGIEIREGRHYYALSYTLPDG